MCEKLCVTAYILAKNEEPNIGKCLRSLELCGMSAILLDSGSTDRTKEIASQFSFCDVRDYHYVDHATAYNWITSQSGSHAVLILDADMEVTEQLWSELDTLLSYTASWQVVKAPVRMYVEGRPLFRGSLYPPKPLLFRSGDEYFVPRGHGEALRSELIIRTARSPIIHNDLKPYSEYLSTQIRYGRNLAKRYASGQVCLKDRIRATSPIMAIIYPFVSLLLRGGILSGRRGLIYALDRAIAALVQYRVVLACKENASQGVKSGDSFKE